MIEYVNELDMQGRKLKFSLPTTLTPSQFVTTESNLTGSEKKASNAEFLVFININMQSNICALHSPTHSINQKIQGKAPFLSPSP